MRIFQSEFAHDYGTYSFGYTLHASFENGDAVETLYDQGFLPYSANPELHNILYMARSVRVPLTTVEPNSENRRVLKKYDGQFVTTTLSYEELKNDVSFHELFLNYFKERHGTIMPRERLDGILKSAFPLRGIRYETTEGVLVAVVLEVATPTFSHFWFSAYDTSYMNTSLGMWLMLDGVRRAHTEERQYTYLGTAYGEKALYKLNVAGIEFWDGQEWNTSAQELKHRVKNDLEQTVTCGTPFDCKDSN